VPGSAESATSMFCVRRAESKDATRGRSCRATPCELARPHFLLLPLHVSLLYTPSLHALPLL